MANIIPLQERAVDPFSSFYSNTVNRLTELVTHDEEGLLTVQSLNVTLDTTSPASVVVVSPGYVVKDDVLIKVMAPHYVDFLDDDNWVTPPDITFAGGRCYVVLHYQYLKQRPAPVATIKILQPYQRDVINLPGSTYLLLKIVELNTLNPHEIIALYDMDPEYGAYKRKYLKYYAGGEVALPDHNRVTDQGRIVYETAGNTFYFGYEDEWKELSVGGVEVTVDTDSTGVFIGQICYVNHLGKSTPSISTSVQTGADLAVTAIGTAVSETGKGIVTGFVHGVPVETGVSISVGDILYLSETDAGTVTNIRPGSLFQILGRALTPANSSNPVDMIFAPKIMLAPSTSGIITTWSGTTGNYYKDIDVSMLDGTSVFDAHWFDDATNKEITPADVEIRNGGNLIRVYMSVNTIDLNYMIQSPESYGGGAGGGGGGGGGTSDHALLLSLDYGGSGHTGFAPSPHGNADHSATYITSSGVNFTNLNANGSVGAGGTQVAIGTHTHPAPPTRVDIPSGTILLFEHNTAVTGYSLITNFDDGVVYITKGSTAGGEVGGSVKAYSTWTQPFHNHGIYGDGSHNHTTGDFTLQTAHMPSHTHGPGWPLITFIGQTGPGIVDSVGRSGDSYSSTTVTAPTGGNAAHNHGASGHAGVHYHTGAVTANGTPLTWRPLGVNYTRQQRIG